MTFPQQIEGVPPHLVEQGWRLCPDDSVIVAWDDKDKGQMWEGETTSERVWIYRPKRAIAATFGKPISIYDHSGWGDGLAPTAEMVRVWPLWWLRDHCGELKVCSVRLNADLDIETADYWIGDRLVFHGDIPEWGLWRGPVLPPARTA